MKSWDNLSIYGCKYWNKVCSSTASSCEVITMRNNMKQSSQINHLIIGMASEIYRDLIINNTHITIKYRYSVLFVIFLSNILFFLLFFFSPFRLPFNMLVMKALHVSFLGLRYSYGVIIVLLARISTLTFPSPFLLFRNKCILTQDLLQYSFF